MSAGGGAPPRDVLLALDADTWAGLLVPARRALRALDAVLADPAAARVLALPGGRLAAGRGREQLVELLLRPDVWAALERELGVDHPRPWRDAVATSAAADEEMATLRAERDAQVAAQGQAAARLARAEERLRSARAERDAAQQAAGTAERVAADATARAEAAEDARAALAAEVAALRAQVADGDAALEREVARTRRRAAAAQGDRAEQLRAARRELHEARAEVGRLRTELAARPARTGAAPPAATSRAAPRQPDLDTDPSPTGGRRGRPSTLPHDLHRETVAATRWLLDRDRLLLVDGYNVTLTQRAELDLAGQRRWLVEGLATLAARRGVDALVVFDARGGRPVRLRPRTGVRVRFTEPELTADDELVFEVDALPLDEPVVVVTDDRGLRERLRGYGVDLLHTHQLVPLLR